MRFIFWASSSVRFLGLSLLMGLTALSGSTIFVTNTNDSGPGSLRQALANANADASITTVSLAQLQSNVAPQAARILLQSPLTVGPNPVEILADTALPHPILEPLDQNHRILILHSRSTGSVQIRHLHFLNGRETDPGLSGVFRLGGAIFYSQDETGEVVRSPSRIVSLRGTLPGLPSIPLSLSRAGGAYLF